jgi:bifunctional non-homologous end joining protein LigD
VLLPQLATLVDAAPAGDEWLHEVKYDGYRVVARIEGGRARIHTRRGHDWTGRFPRLAARLAALPCSSALLDGELVVLDGRGRTSFAALQAALAAEDEDALVLYLFDLPHLDGSDLRETPLSGRKERLRALVERAARGTEPPLLRYSDHLVGQGPHFFRQACEWGLEGIVSKRADAPYRSRRTRDWLKVKCLRRQEMVVGGFTEPGGTRVGLGALLLGYYDDEGRFRHAGKVGAGFGGEMLRELRRRLAETETARPPFVDLHRMKGAHWVEPRMVVEISFTEWTPDGMLRHPIFQGLREDKDPREVRREMPVHLRASASGIPTPERKAEGTRARKRRSSSPSAASPSPVTALSPRKGGKMDERAVAGVRLTHPDRVLDARSGLTKRALARYYEAVGEWMLPHASGRLLTLVRCPEGVGGECFYQKHAGEAFPKAIRRVPLDEGDGDETYTAVDSVAGLVSLVQIGVMEVHVWGSRADRPERPDRIVMDLDPAPDVPWARVVRGALTLRERLASLGLESFVKSTGGKGLHVVVPLARRSTWAEVKGFSRALAREAAARQPGEFVTQSTLARRGGRIFIDWLRNGRGATAVCAYSVRARPGAPVSVPLRWDELDSKRMHKYSTATIIRRLRSLKADPWEGFEAAARQTLTQRMRDEIGAR